MKKDLSDISGQSSFGPFGGHNSMSRMDMAANSHIRHDIPPVNAEAPLIDSTHSQRFLYSTENIKMKKITYLYRADKVIDGHITRKAYIFYNHETDEVDIEIVDQYENSYLFAYQKVSELDNYKPGDTIEDIYISHYTHFDPKYNETKYGVNLNVLYNTGAPVLEDGIYVSEEASKKMTINHFYDIKFTLSKNQMMRNIFGNGSMYNPLPFIGQEIKDYNVASVVNNISNLGVLFMKNAVSTYDTRYLVHGGYPVDIEVIGEVASPIGQIEAYRIANIEFYMKITKVLEEAQRTYKLSKNAIYLKENNVYSLKHYRIKIKELKKSLYINVKVVYPKPIGPGDKMTNRHGGKGVVSDIFKEPIVMEDGTPIDVMINVTGIGNRENIGQKYEHDISALNLFLMKYLKESDDTYDVKFNNIVKWLRVATLQKTANEVEAQFKSKEEKKEYVDYCSENPMTLKFAPFPKYHLNDPEELFIFERFMALRDFTKKLYPKLGPFKVFEGGKEWVNKIDGTKSNGTHYYGKVFYMALENGPIKDTQIRADGILNAKGYVSKKGEDKKSNQSLWGTTGNKMSDLVTNIALNTTLPERYEILEKSMKILNDYTIPMGFHFKTHLKNITDKNRR